MLRLKARVLVVDDEKDIRELIKFYLNKEGFEVLEAGDGEEAFLRQLQGKSAGDADVLSASHDLLRSARHHAHLR